MLRIRQVKLVPLASEDSSSRFKRLKKKVASLLGISISDIESIKIVKESVDARKKPEVCWVYTVDVKLSGKDEGTVLKKTKGADISVVDEASQDPGAFFVSKAFEKKMRPLVVGAGPAGLFAAYCLALAGCGPLLIERGKSVDERKADVEGFWRGARLDPESNVLFGEGGAGTFSDGKLNSGIKDINGRVDSILRTFVKFGAPSSILYSAHPHVGTDVLRSVIRNMREEIISLGGEVRFETRLTGIEVQGGKLCGALVNESERIGCDALILAVGHSARDTFLMLKDAKVSMEPKSFAVGYRLMHEQGLINLSQYGEKYKDCFGASPYKLTAKTTGGRGVYSFCMCPGGYVVNASSQEGALCINGMSYSGRNGDFANSAIVVTVDETDYSQTLKAEGMEYEADDPLQGVYFQQLLERRAYASAKGCIPVQTFYDFKKQAEGNLPLEGAGLPDVSGGIKGLYAKASLRGILPESLENAFMEAMASFGRKIKGFDSKEAVMAAVESRTSSPVRILRDRDCVSLNVKGLYPCGEGAGYAGGIVSAAVDGMRAAARVLG